MAAQPKQRDDLGDFDLSEDRVMPGQAQSNQGQQSSWKSTSSTASWRSLFVFTNRQHGGSIACAGAATIVAGIVKPVAAIFYGKAFGVLTNFGSGAANSTQTLHEISKWCIALTALGIAAWILGGALLSTWIIFGELQAKSARQQIFTGMVDREMEWYDLREDGIGSLLNRIQM